MRMRDKLHTMKTAPDEWVETYLMNRAQLARVQVSQGRAWLTPAKLRRLAKRLIWCADRIESKHGR